MLFPASRDCVTGVELRPVDDGLPLVTWLGLVPAGGLAEDAAAAPSGPHTPLLGEHA